MDWLQIVSTLGFPIACCIAMAWYVKYITDQNNTEVSKLNEQHKTEMLAYKDEIKDAINNNTIVMQKLCDSLQKGGFNNGEIK